MPRWLRWLSVSGLVVCVDQITKHAVVAALSYGERVSVLPFFDLVYVLNPGAAFSFLADHAGWQRWFFISLAVAISVWMLRLMRQHAGAVLMPLACALIVGGAFGNVIDRLVVGAVIDFLYVFVGRYGWPAFNVADSAITVGAALMVWAEMRASRASPSQ